MAVENVLGGEMVTSNHARMLGDSPRQPFCGKCCGEHTKAGNTVNKRADRRSSRQSLKQETRCSTN